MKKSVAVIGSGVSGLSVCWLLHKQYKVTLFEKNDYIGGHTHTVDVQHPDASPTPVDTGFIVYNEKNYPNLVGLFSEIGIKTQLADMSFSFSANAGELEYSGSGFKGLFAQKRNVFSPRHWLLLKEIVRFNRLAHRALDNGIDAGLNLGDFLLKQRFSADLMQHYLLPMGAAIWSCPVETMLQFPANSFLRFFANHGLIDLRHRPQWRTVVGGSSVYVRRLLHKMGDRLAFQPGAISVIRGSDTATVSTAEATHRFDAVVFACHADEALALLGAGATQAESNILGHFAYETNQTWLHTDTRLMPKRKAVWSCWNYLSAAAAAQQPRVCVSYWMNRLQHLPEDTPYLVTLNPPVQPDPEHVIERFEYQHPVFSERAIKAQALIATLQGQNHSWFCGSYCGYGFHEDGLKSAIAVCKDFGVVPSWQPASIRDASGVRTSASENILKPGVAIS